MALIEAVKTSRAPMLTLGAVGVFWGGLAGLMPDLKAGFAASDAEMGFAMMMPAIGSLVAMALAPRYGRVFGGWALPLAGLGLVAAFFLPLFAVTIVQYGLLLFFAGAALSFADMTANVRIAQLEARRGLHLQNVNHAAYSLFFGVTALSVGIARRSGAHYSEVLPVLAVVALIAIVAGWDRRPLPPIEEDDGPRGAVPPWGTVLLAGAVLCAAFIGENATEAWSALHIERTLGGPAGEGSFGPATLGFVMAAGRFSGQLVAVRLGEVRLIFGSAALAVIGALVLAAAPSPAIAFVAVAMLAAGLAVIVPTTNSILGRAVSDAARPLAISRAWMAGMVGFFMGPSLMGALAQAFGLRVAFVAVAVIVALILPSVLALGRRATRG